MTFCKILLFPGLAGSMLAQSLDPPKPAPIDPRVRNLVRQFVNAPFAPRPVLLSPVTLTAQPVAGAVCSVPLLEAPVPQDTKFTMKLVSPPAGRTDSMPVTSGPAPTCLEAPR